MLRTTLGLSLALAASITHAQTSDPCAYADPLQFVPSFMQGSFYQDRDPLPNSPGPLTLTRPLKRSISGRFYWHDPGRMTDLQAQRSRVSGSGKIVYFWTRGFAIRFTAGVGGTAQWFNGKGVTVGSNLPGFSLYPRQDPTLPPSTTEPTITIGTPFANVLVANPTGDESKPGMYYFDADVDYPKDANGFPIRGVTGSGAVTITAERAEIVPPDSPTLNMVPCHRSNHIKMATLWPSKECFRISYGFYRSEWDFKENYKSRIVTKSSVPAAAPPAPVTKAGFLDALMPIPRGTEGLSADTDGTSFDYCRGPEAF